jgi:hypothetical protein
LVWNLLQWSVKTVSTPTINKYILMSHYMAAGQKHSIKVANRSFEDVAKFRYLGTTLTDQNCMHEEIKSRLNSYLLSRNLKVLQ